MPESQEQSTRSAQEEGVLQSEIADDVFPAIRWLFTAGGVPLLASIVWVEVIRSSADGMLWLLCAIFVVFLAGTWAPTSQRLRAWGLSAGLLLTALVGMVRYGPVAGNAALLVAAAFVASAVLGRRAANLVTGLALGGFAAIAMGFVSGRLHAPPPSGTADGLIWLRIGLSFGVSLVVMVMVFNRLVSAGARLTAKNRESLRQAKAAEASFRELVEATPELIVIHRKTETLYVNPALRRLVGPQGAEGSLGVNDWVHPDDLDDLEARASVSGRPLVPRQLRLRRSDGRYVEAEFLALNVEYQGQSAQVDIGRDVTERNAMLARLALSDRLASLGTLAAGVAHELNNPLAFVRANLEYLSAELSATRGPDAPPLATPEELLAALQEAQQGTERMRLIIRDLGALTRADGVTKGSIDPRRAVLWAVERASPLLRERARLEQDVADGLEIEGNEAHLRQVLLNLIMNAARAIAPGAASRNLVRITGRLEGRRVLIEVSDTGPGMTAEVRKRALEPFFTTQPTGEGTGLGLWVCHNLVTAMGGELTVESEPGRGTRFCISAKAANA